MITKTSLLATRALLCLVNDQSGIPISPRNIALQLGESQAYMAKVLRALVKAGILRAEHGSRGGVLLSRPPFEITLLAIVEACQGAIVGSYCQETPDLRTTCAFHRAAVELRHAIVSVLTRWTLEHLAASPRPAGPLPGGMLCMLAGVPVKPEGRQLRRQGTSVKGDEHL
ncbi:MAG TPA: Rrf2 family transcriptional regulator [Candidatus Angelobacter sp.]